MKDILSSQTAERKMKRMALEVAERNQGAKEMVIIGIRSNGYSIAKKMTTLLSSFFTGSVSLVELTMNKKEPSEIILDKDMDLKGKSVLLVDDVANSGRTMLHALKPIIEQKPGRVETLALIERTHKKYPVAINYVGLSVSTTLEEHIEVLVENGEVTGARMQ